eukprot:COSAG02_NODE_3684_length_6385_cov_4.179287_8_plen_120_part_00
MGSNAYVLRSTFYTRSIEDLAARYLAGPDRLCLHGTNSQARSASSRLEPPQHINFRRYYANDFLEIANISVAASIVELSASSRLYNRWLKLHGARMDRKTIDKKQRRVWTGIKAVPEEM